MNPTGAPQTARVEYLHENGLPYAVDVPVPAWARATVERPAWMPLGSYGMKVTSASGAMGFIAERAMYQIPDFTVGTAGVGQREPGVYWAFTEGETGWWDTYFLLANPQTVEAHIYLRFTRTDGTVIAEPYFHVPPRSRRTVRVKDVFGMADVAFRTEVYSVGSPPTEYVVERATFWPGAGPSMLMTTPGQEWTATMSAIADEPASATVAPAPLFDTGVVTPYASPGRVSPVALYHEVTQGEPAGPMERALAAAYGKQQQKEKGKKPKGTTDDHTVTTESGVSTLTSGSGWFGGHVTGGRKR